MSMNLELYTISDSDIRDIVEEPLRLEMLHYGQILDPEQLDDLEEPHKQSISGWLPKIKPDIFYIEGMFQSLHYLLTLETEWGLGAFPLNFLTGKRLDIGEIGWGKATFYYADEVKEITEALNGLNYDELRKRYNADFFNEKKIYPRGYTWMPTDEESLLDKLKEITEFFGNAKDNNLGIYRVLV
ncbi:hypothetical protein A4H97_29725 [Niastella yeongjuensis]|uniref:DUF1877 domain-containing protein n=1 Tax=Niastella yeongjuensis TaxID=354355 RepID=A0A1V9EPE8_9BACT|nr:DUF1877 family protein [Niastella yeongjuensis]OQP48019.1 hypothetical protein A4H97_29725 [Niastella yeongjuensis]SEO23718.1 protein of unknown function [Niastella yeongjuensis]